MGGRGIRGFVESDEDNKNEFLFFLVVFFLKSIGKGVFGFGGGG